MSIIWLDITIEKLKRMNIEMKWNRNEIKLSMITALVTVIKLVYDESWFRFSFKTEPLDCRLFDLPPNRLFW